MSSLLRAPAPGLSAAAARLGLPVAVIVILVLAWPIAAGPARGTLESSWQVALHLAKASGLRYGVDFVWTYGPLGFLGYPQPYVASTSSWALLTSIAVYGALIAALLVATRRLLPGWGAVVLTLLAARTLVVLPLFEAFQALVAILCAEALAGGIALSTTAMAAIAGIAVGAAALGKINVAVFVALMTAIAVVSMERRPWRAAAVYLGAAVATGIGLWLAAGQPLAGIPAEIAETWQVVSGYNEAMGGDVLPSRAWIHLAFAGVVVLVAWAGWTMSRHWPRGRRVGLAAAGLALGFAMWKTMIVREHVQYVFATGLLLLLALGAGLPRSAWLASILAVGIAVAASAPLTPRAYADLLGSARAFAGEVADALVPGRSRAASDRTRAQLQSAYAIEPEVLAAIGSGTVHIDPYFTSVAAAYPDLRWSPLPVFQSYSAWTPQLDGMDALRLASDRAPDRILRSFRAAPESDLLRHWIDRPFRQGEVFPATLDGRFRWFEAPQTTLETFCRYRQVVATETWQVLSRTASSCGAPEPLATVQGRAGDPVQVPLDPRQDRFVIVRIRGLAPSLLGAVTAGLTKAPDWYISLDDTRYRLVPATAPDGLLMAVPAAADGSGRFAFGPSIRSLTVTQGDSGTDSRAPLTFEFESVPWISGP